MQEIYPGFYHEFKCIANLCEDSCCKDWDIDIDSETEAFYQTVQGPLGDKMRRLLVTDEYDERVFRCTNGRCPFWNSDMLCDIYIGIGEEHLSNTCANFPRVAVDYGNFREHILSFACPEAARFMLKNTRDAYADFGGERELGLSDESGDYMSFLLKARERSAEIGFAGYRGTETLVDFPALIKLPDCAEGFSYADALPDGTDIYFTAADGTVLSHEIDTWNASGRSLLWVKVPSLDRSTRITMHWGGGSAAQVPSASSVWTGYVGVWHMNVANGAAGTAEPDATGHGLDAVPSCRQPAGMN